MDTFQLRYALLCMCKDIQPFVCAKNELKFIKNKTFSIIFNTSNNYSKGTHWCVIYKSDDSGEVQFFDSLGLPYYYYGNEIIEFLRCNSSFVRYNVRPVQSNSSISCGMFCLYFIYNRLCKINYDNVIAMFSNNKFKNDILVHDFVTRSFNFPKFMNCFKNECCNKKCILKNFSSVCCNVNHKCITLQWFKNNKNKN